MTCIRWPFCFFYTLFSFVRQNVCYNTEEFGNRGIGSQ